MKLKVEKEFKEIPIGKKYRKRYDTDQIFEIEEKKISNIKLEIGKNIIRIKNIIKEKDTYKIILKDIYGGRDIALDSKKLNELVNNKALKIIYN